MENFCDVKKYIDEAKTICLSTHVMPDGDAIGSVGAMYHFLKEIGKEVYMIVPEMMSKFHIMPSISDVKQSVDLKEYDLLIALDTSNNERMAIDNEDIKKAKNIVVIDHHKMNSVDCNIKIVDDNAPANCEIVYRFLKYMNHKISKNIADYIYLGLMTDSGSFNYERTTGDTYRIAGEMVDIGADFANICKVMNDTYSEAKMKLIAHIIDNMETYFGGKVRIAVIDKNVQDKYGATKDDVDNLVNYLRCIENTIVSIYIREKEEGIFKVSMRSEEPIDAAAIALKMGGGGHKRAAGFDTNDVENVKQELLKMLERLL